MNYIYSLHNSMDIFMAFVIHYIFFFSVLNESIFIIGLLGPNMRKSVCIDDLL